MTMDRTLLDEFVSSSLDGENADRIINAFLNEQEGASFSNEKELLDALASLTFDMVEEKDYATFLLDGYLLEGIKEIARPRQNPYFDLLKGKKIKKGDLELGWGEYKPFSLFPYDQKELKEGKDISKLAWCKQKITFPYLSQKGRIWMSIIPHEEKTMEIAVSKAKGNVLTFGCGLGYFAFMASLKEEVKKVTIIEKDEKISSFFLDHLLPLFPHKEKIELIIGDALSFSPKSTFDFLFVDVYHDAVDGLPFYLKALKKKWAKEEGYWIEKDMLIYLRRFIAAYLEEKENGQDEAIYQRKATFIDRIFSKLHRYFLKHPIEDINVLNEFDKLKQIAKDI